LAHGALNARIAPLWIGHEQKFFAKYGVESTVILVRQIQIMVSGLGTGEIDIALTSGSTLLGASAGGLDAKMIAALNGRVTYDLVAAPWDKNPQGSARQAIWHSSIRRRTLDGCDARPGVVGTGSAT
jgi:ABC-type nitrate/sulfonate/bicarbonate transport system substrate-binding protein